MTKHLLFALGVTALVLMPTAATQAQLTAGAIYDFDAENNSGDPTSFTNTGTLGGSLGVVGTVPTLTPAGGIELFDHYGSQGVAGGSFDVLSGSAVNIENGFSYEMHVRRTGNALGGEHQLAAVTEDVNTDNRIFLNLQEGSNPDAIDVKFRTLNGDNNGALDDIITLPQDTWLHFILTFDDTTDVLKVYENNVNTITDTTNFVDVDFLNVAANNVTLFKNRGSENDDRRFNGDIHVARLYDFVLTPAQVNANFNFTTNSTVIPPDPGDFNDDGFINIVDYGILRDHLNAHLDGPVGFADGDFDLDDDVDLDDFSQFKNIYPGGLQALAADLAQVPEPSSILLLAGALAGLVNGRVLSRSEAR